MFNQLPIQNETFENYYIKLGFALYILLGIIAVIAIILNFSEPPTSLSEASDSLVSFGFLALFAIFDVALPLIALKGIAGKQYNHRNMLYYFIAPTITGIRYTVLIPIAIYNVILVLYFYNRLKTGEVSSEPSAEELKKAYEQQKEETDEETDNPKQVD